jgi:hypothetical protein
MAARRGRPYDCGVVNETVHIRLKNRRVGGFSGSEIPFVQCDQLDCQYVEDNEAPCPLRIAMFSDELQDRADRAQKRRDEFEY